MLESLAHVVVRRRLLVIGAWLVLTLFGAFAAGKASDRFFESFSLPGYEAWEANQRAVKTFGTGDQPPLVAVFTTRLGDITQKRGIAKAVAAAVAVNPGARASSYFSTGNEAYVSKNRTATFAELYLPGEQSFFGPETLDKTREALKAAAPAGVSAHLTGRDALYADQGGSEGPSVLIEVLIGGVGAIVILLLVFGTLPAVAMPLLVAIASILNTFTLVWLMTYVTDVSLIVQFLVALIGLGVAIDYSLLMIFRFRDELQQGTDVEEALVRTMRHAGRSVIVSGSTVAIGLLSLIILPVPFIRSIGVGGMLIPAVSVLSSITLLPALLSLLGHRINSLRVLPRRLTHADEHGFWSRWSRLVVRRPLPVALAGLAIVALLLIPAVQMNPSEAELEDFPGKGDAFDGRDALTAAGISHGVLKPFVVLVEDGAEQATLGTLVRRLEATEGIAGAAAPPGPAWRRGGAALVEAFPATDSASRSARKTISRLKNDVLPAAEAEAGGSTRMTLGGVAPADRDFVRAVYGNFPWVLLFVVVLTFVLLMRAFRSVVLPLKAVILNLLSLGAAFGIVVFIFQMGHGSKAIWGVDATDSITSWIPLMIFAFLYGLSMDYEVFMLSRMREAYDETRDTGRAIELGLARTGKLVTSAALVLMFAFFVLSTSPGVDVKQFGIGLAAGIILDATLIRALLVPSLMKLIGRWNWWLPEPAARVLFTRPSRPAPEAE